MVSEISQQTFKDWRTLSEGLKLHIIPAINRLNANIETHNPLTEMIKHKYPRLFESVHQGLIKHGQIFNFQKVKLHLSYYISVVQSKTSHIFL